MRGPSLRKRDSLPTRISTRGAAAGIAISKLAEEPWLWMTRRSGSEVKVAAAIGACTVTWELSVSDTTASPTGWREVKTMTSARPGATAMPPMAELEGADGLATSGRCRGVLILANTAATHVRIGEPGAA